IVVLYIMCLCSVFYFFFSSRRRHTRSKRDWSSDVCSSDLLYDFIRDYKLTGRSRRVRVKIGSMMIGSTLGELHLRENHSANIIEIGRASCRERGEISVVGD